MVKIQFTGRMALGKLLEACGQALQKELPVNGFVTLGRSSFLDPINIIFGDVSANCGSMGSLSLMADGALAVKNVKCKIDNGDNVNFRMVVIERILFEAKLLPVVENDTVKIFEPTEQGDSPIVVE